MKYFIVFTLTVCFQYSHAQKKLDFGVVAGQPISKCKDAKNPVCKSSYQLDIYWTAVSPMFGSSTTIHLTFDGKKWAATQYHETLQKKSDTVKLIPTTSYDSIFNALKKNKIFTLPDQDSLQLGLPILDGSDYSLVFKAGNKFRRYTFNNPAIHKEKNPTVKELSHYIAIINILSKGFKEQQFTNKSVVK